MMFPFNVFIKKMAIREIGRTKIKDKIKANTKSKKRFISNVFQGFSENLYSFISSMFKKFFLTTSPLLSISIITILFCSIFWAPSLNIERLAFFLSMLGLRILLFHHFLLGFLFTWPVISNHKIHVAFLLNASNNTYKQYRT